MWYMIKIFGKHNCAIHENSWWIGSDTNSVYFEATLQHHAEVSATIIPRTMAGKSCVCVDCSIGQLRCSTPVNGSKCLCCRRVSRIAKLRQRLFGKRSKKGCNNSYQNLSVLDDYPFQVRDLPSCDISHISDWSLSNTTSESAYLDNSITSDSISMATSPSIHIATKQHVTSDNDNHHKYHSKTISRKLKNFHLNLRFSVNATTLAVLWTFNEH
jgi:hypothetical protein